MRDRLDETLAELQEQLRHADDLDERQRLMLRQTVEEIEQTLDDAEVSSHSIAQRLQDATRQFEQSHPQLTATVGRIADLLSQLGI